MKSGHLGASGGGISAGIIVEILRTVTFARSLYPTDCANLDHLKLKLNNSIRVIIFVLH